MFFEKTTWKNWLTQFRAVTRQLVADNERLMTEHIEWLQKMQELNEEKEMIKKLARNQAQELQEAWEKACKFEQLFNDADAERKTLKSGLTNQPGDVKTLTIVKVTEAKEETPATFAPAVITLNPEGTKVINREVQVNTDYEFAVNNGKILFMKLFSPDEMETN